MRVTVSNATVGVLKNQLQAELDLTSASFTNNGII